MQDEHDEEVVEEGVEEEVDQASVLDSDKPTSPNATNTGGEGIQTETNPQRVSGETYEEYTARRVAAGQYPASEAEWANAEPVDEADVEEAEADVVDEEEVDDEDEDDEED